MGNIHKTEFVRVDMLFKSLSGFKRDGHPDYQVIDEELQKDYHEKFMAQGAVAQSICAEQQNEKVYDDDVDGAMFENMLDEEFELEEDKNERNRNDENDMESEFPHDLFEDVDLDIDEHLLKESENVKSKADDNIQLTPNDEALQKDKEKLSPEEDEYQEYRKNDPVAKWQYTEDNHILMVDMSPENMFNFETMSCSNVSKSNPVPVTEKMFNVPTNENMPKPSTSTAEGNAPSVPAVVNSSKPSTSTAEGNSSKVSSAANNDPTVTIAPGEGQVQINITGMKNYDIKAFPHLHPDGTNGIDQERVVKLSTSTYIDQRINNKNPAFSNCKGWVYSMLSKLEKEQLESKMSLGYTKGTLKNNADGTQSYSLDDPFTVLDKISNSPKYWQAYKSELIAKLKNFGPFQFFFTLSCAEKRYMENITTLLRQKFGKDLNITIRYVDHEEVELDENHQDNLFNEFDDEMLFEDCNNSSNPPNNHEKDADIRLQEELDRANFDLNFDLDSENDELEQILSSNIKELSKGIVFEETTKSTKNQAKTPSKKRKKKDSNIRSLKTKLKSRNRDSKY